MGLMGFFGNAFTAFGPASVILLLYLSKTPSYIMLGLARYDAILLHHNGKLNKGGGKLICMACLNLDCLCSCILHHGVEFVEQHDHHVVLECNYPGRLSYTQCLRL